MSGATDAAGQVDLTKLGGPPEPVEQYLYLIGINVERRRDA